MTTLTRPQRVSLEKVYQRILYAHVNNGTIGPIPSYRQFRRNIGYGWDCIMVQFAGMWLGIEKDGYTHS